MKKDNDLFIVTLEERACIDYASELSEELLKALNNYKSVKVNIQKTEKIDASIFQLLLSAKYYAEKEKKQFSIVGDLKKSVLNQFNVEDVNMSDHNISLK